MTINVQPCMKYGRTWEITLELYNKHTLTHVVINFEKYAIIVIQNFRQKSMLCECEQDRFHLILVIFITCLYMCTVGKCLFPSTFNGLLYLKAYIWAFTRANEANLFFNRLGHRPLVWSSLPAPGCRLGCFLPRSSPSLTCKTPYRHQF